MGSNCLLYFALLVNFCVVTMLDLSNNKSFNCSKKYNQDCTLSHNVLNCTNFAVSNSHVNSDGRREFSDNYIKCVIFSKRRKSKKYNCFTLLHTELQSSVNHTSCYCNCIPSHKIWSLGINRRDTNNIAPRKIPYKISVLPVQEKGRVDVIVETNISSENSPRMVIFCLKKRKSEKNCSNDNLELKRFFNRTYNLILPKETFNFNISLDPGNYCLIIRMYSDNHDEKYPSTFKDFEMKLPKNETIMLASSGTESGFDNNFFIYIVVFFVFMFIILPTIIYRLLKRKGTVSIKSMHNQTIDLQKPKVLVMYGSHDEEHVRKVKLFANVLEECCNCSVVADWIDDELHKSAKNMELWVLNAVERCNKIVIINCEATFKRQDQYIKGQMRSNLPYSDKYLYRVFDDFLYIVHSKIEYKNKIFNVRFFETSNNCKLKVIGGDCLEIPLQLRDLFIYLHDLNPMNATETPDLTKDCYKRLCCQLNVQTNSTQQSFETNVEQCSPSSTVSLISQNESCGFTITI